MSKPFLITLAACLFGGLAANAEIETYRIDPTHSSVKFSIRHFVSKTSGNFNQFEGMLTLNRDDLSNSNVNARIQVNSVDTANVKRDAHLQEDDFFNAAEYPLITFQSTRWAVTADANKFKVSGDLTMLNTTREITLDVVLLGFGPGMHGAQLSGWEATTQLDRTEWGILGGQPAVGTTVHITINIEAIRQ